MSGPVRGGKKIKLEPTPQAVPAPVPGPYPPFPGPWPPPGIPIDPALGGPPQGGAPVPPPYGFSFIPPGGAQQRFGPPPAGFSYGTIQMAPQPPAQAQGRANAGAGSSSGGAGGGGGELHDVSTLNDSLASAGVDLRAEEENLRQQAGSHRRWPEQGDRTKRSNFIDSKTLSNPVSTIARHHGLSKGASDESLQYLALALKARLHGLITSMLDASEHRTTAQATRPAGLWDPHNAEDATAMWTHTVRRDVGLQLAALEKAEREDEQRIRKERKERQEAQAAALAAMQAPSMPMPGAMDDDEGPAKKKRKKEGPGVSARNMSEDVRKKMSNAVASQAAGISTKKYSWMTEGGSANSTPQKPKTRPATATTPAGQADSAPGTPVPGTPGGPASAAPTPAASGTSKPFVAGKGKAGANGTAAAATAAQNASEPKTVTLRDAMFAIQRERGHGGGRGAARGWT